MTARLYAAVAEETHGAVKGMLASIAARGVEVSKNTYWTHLQNVIDDYCVGVSPQKLSGVALTSHLEKKIEVVVTLGLQTPPTIILYMYRNVICIKPK